MLDVGGCPVAKSAYLTPRGCKLDTIIVIVIPM